MPFLVIGIGRADGTGTGRRQALSHRVRYLKEMNIIEKNAQNQTIDRFFM
jgi:hypothetical protein